MLRYARRHHLYVVREPVPEVEVAGDPAAEVEAAREVAPEVEVAGDPAAEVEAARDPALPTEDDLLDDLAEEICVLAAHIHAATQHLLELIAEFDRRRGWEPSGHRSCAHWLAFRTGIALGAAREKVRAARALVDLPETRAAMARGELSFSKVRAITRVATPENETDLLNLAAGCTTAQTERVVRAWKRGSREAEGERERELYASRTFSVFPDDEGMYRVKGRLPAEVGALLMRAVEAAGDQLFRKENPAADHRDTRKAAAQRRADALGLIAERAMAAGFGGSDGAERAPISGTRAERYQVVLHVSAETLSSDGEGDCCRNGKRSRRGGRPSEGSGSQEGDLAPEGDLAQEGDLAPEGDLAQEGDLAPDGKRSHRSNSVHDSDRSHMGDLSHLDDGTRLTAETSRRLSCDAARVRMTHDDAGGILDVGRRTRTIPPALRRALDFRDRGCRFPGCGLRFTDAHHVRHWADGGETSLVNCLLLCRHHHRLVHEGGWSVRWWGVGRPEFIDPRGGTHYDGGWEAPELPDNSVDALVDRHRAAGVDPDGYTASAHWKRERDIPDEVYFRALEASA